MIVNKDKNKSHYKNKSHNNLSIEIKYSKYFFSYF